MVGQPHQNFMKMASWSRVSEHLVNLIGMSDQLKWNNQKELGIFFNHTEKVLEYLKPVRRISYARKNI